MIELTQSCIVACCTAKGAAAVALIRTSGHNAFSVINKIARFPSQKTIFDFESHVVRYGHVVHPETKNIIDEVMFLIMRGPKTFTGFDTVEITSHGNPLIVQKIIDACVLAGARIAQRGEFTRQAVANDRIDVLQAEAIHELIIAQNDRAVESALRQVSGSLSQKIFNLEEKIVRLLAFVEASFEFIEEEHVDLAYAQLVDSEYQSLIVMLSELIAHCESQKHLKNGFQIACVGSVNAGKSTLFNRFVGADRSIVTDVAGTTRDVVDATIVRSGMQITFVDTAGIRESDDLVERIGISRSSNQIELADLVLLVVDVSRVIEPEEFEFYKKITESFSDKLILVQNKVDELMNDQSKWLLNGLAIKSVVAVSGLSGYQLPVLWQLIEEKIQLQVSHSSTPYILNERHVAILQSVSLSISQIQNNLGLQPQFELAAFQLRNVLQVLSSMTGRNLTERVLDQIFTSFCLGK
jgi:tRNA modification GTPase